MITSILKYRLMQRGCRAVMVRQTGAVYYRTPCGKSLFSVNQANDWLLNKTRKSGGNDVKN